MYLNADAVLKSLMEGNQRFLQGLRSVKSIATPEQLVRLSQQGQKPQCIVLTCSDSRVPAELIFDQGLGDLFVIRVAGNVVAPSLIASMEFAVSNFKSPLILVLGHTKCGAVDAACAHHGSCKSSGSKNLDDLISRIAPSVEKCFSKDLNKQQLVDKVTMANVKHSISEILSNSQIIAQKCEASEVKIVGGVFELESGRVVLEESAAWANAPISAENLLYKHLSDNGVVSSS